jgi:hypothetical protein
MYNHKITIYTEAMAYERDAYATEWVGCNNAIIQKQKGANHEY